MKSSQSPGHYLFFGGCTPADAVLPRQREPVIVVRRSLL